MSISFEATYDIHPSPASESASESRAVAFTGLPRGDYDLYIDGMAIRSSGEGRGKKAGIEFRVFYYENGPDFDQSEKLRQAIIAKNRLFFYRWRPANETYLFGFRKHEQGKNAAEMPMFDPLIEKMEAEIAKLRVPVKHVYELKKVEAKP